MNFAPQIEILDLRHFNGRQLRPILQQEAVLWWNRLRWDYASSTELLLQYLDLQILPGFVALLRGRIIGYCFCVYEGNKAVIGDIFVLPDVLSPLAVTRTLTRHLLEVLENSPDIDRIEAQLLLFDTGVLSGTFLDAGFSIFPRMFLECELTRQPPFTGDSPGQASLPASLELCKWIPGYYQATAELIHAAYQGHLDSQINDQYRTLHGSLRFLHNIVRFPGCGIFDPEASWVLRDRQSNALVGVILCSQVAAGVAHVTQICISPSLRGQGIGWFLLSHCMNGLRARDCRALTLTVSEDNRPALRLYTAAGFTTRLRFEALVLEKKVSPERHPVKPGHLSDLLEPSPLASGSLGEGEPTSSGGLFSFARRKAIPTRN